MKTLRKGRRLEIKVAAQIRRKGLDPHARRMPRSGAIEHLKQDILTSLQYSFEVKNQETVRLWEFWEEARSRARMGKPPVLIVSGAFRPILAVMDFDALLNLMKIERDYLAEVKQ